MNASTGALGLGRALLFLWMAIFGIRLMFQQPPLTTRQEADSG